MSDSPVESQGVSGRVANLLRVAAVHLPRLSAEDREPDEADPVSALRKYVEGDMR